MPHFDSEQLQELLWFCKTGHGAKEVGWEGKALISNTLIYDSIYSQLVDNVTTIRLR